MYKQTSEIFTVFLQPMVFVFNVLLLQKTYDPLLQLTAAFSRNDLHQLDFTIHCFINNILQSLVNGIAFVIDIVKVQLKFGHINCLKQDFLFFEYPNFLAQKIDSGTNDTCSNESNQVFKGKVENACKFVQQIKKEGV